MKIEPLKSGSYRIRKMYKGKTYQIITPYKPTQKEALKLMADAMEKDVKPIGTNTFESYVNLYVEDKAMLSPATTKAYLSYVKNMPEWFKEMRITNIEIADIQRLITWYCLNKSTKYARNVNGLISAVLGLYRPSFNYKVNYTSVTQKDAEKDDYIPTAEEVKRVLDEMKGTRWEIPIMLSALTGIRRGELCALTIEDLVEDDNGDNWLNINKDLVIDKDNNRIIKPPKTKASVRTIFIPKILADKIREQGYIYDGYPNSLYDYLQGTIKRLGIPQFSLHKLRHFYCTELNRQGVNEADIMKMGGWSTPNVMKTVYRHERISRDADANKNASMNVWKNTMGL